MNVFSGRVTQVSLSSFWTLMQVSVFSVVEKLAAALLLPDSQCYMENSTSHV